MKKVFLAAFVLAAFSILIWFLVFQKAQEEESPGNLYVYLPEAGEMVRRGEYAAALERYIWFHEHALEHDPHMTGVRLSFALGGWRRLAEVYPPALEAMVETRDRAAAQVRSGVGGWDIFHDVQSLNEKLEDEALTVELFQHLHEKNPALAERVWDLARSAVIEAGEYELAREYIGNPVHALAKHRRSYERDERWTEDDEKFKEMYREHKENQFVEGTLELMEVFSGLGREDLVQQIGTEALETFRDPRIEYALER